MAVHYLVRAEARKLTSGVTDMGRLFSLCGGAPSESRQAPLSIEHDVESRDCLDLRQTPKQPHRLDRIHALLVTLD